MSERYGPVFQSILRDERRRGPEAPHVIRKPNGEVWREGIPAPSSQPYNRHKFLGWVDYMATPKPPHWPQAGWWAGAGINCHVTGLETMGEAIVALLDSAGIDVSEYRPSAEADR